MVAAASLKVMATWVALSTQRSASVRLNCPALASRFTSVIGLVHHWDRGLPDVLTGGDARESDQFWWTEAIVEAYARVKNNIFWRNVRQEPEAGPPENDLQVE